MPFQCADRCLSNLCQFSDKRYKLCHPREASASTVLTRKWKARVNHRLAMKHIHNRITPKPIRWLSICELIQIKSMNRICTHRNLSVERFKAWLDNPRLKGKGWKCLRFNALKLRTWFKFNQRKWHATRTKFWAESFSLSRINNWLQWKKVQDSVPLSSESDFNEHDPHDRQNQEHNEPTKQHALKFARNVLIQWTR